MDTITFQCVKCLQTYISQPVSCRCDCGEVLEVKQSFGKLSTDIAQTFDLRRADSQFFYGSGVWRYKELLVPIEGKYIVTKPEGNTNLYEVGKTVSYGVKSIGEYCNAERLSLKHEGENPTGSFKDRGMTVGVSFAKHLGVRAVACASTGNTSSSLASYAALAAIPCFVFLPKGKIARSKLAQSLAYGAVNIQIDGDFDDAMKLVERVCREYKIYLLNSINSLRLEGQKTIAFEMLQQLGWRVPDWIVLPGGNLGNTAAIGKGLQQLKDIGIIKELPRIAVIQAVGANPFYKSYKKDFRKKYTVAADTIASAIKIGNPVSYLRAQKVIKESNGVVEQVNDTEILDAKMIIDRSGIGCESASATTVAGLKKLIGKKVIAKDAHIVGILTGHLLKDPDVVIKQYEQKALKKASIFTISSEKNLFETIENVLSRN